MVRCIRSHLASCGNSEYANRKNAIEERVRLTNLTTLFLYLPLPKHPLTLNIPQPLFTALQKELRLRRQFPPTPILQPPITNIRILPLLRLTPLSNPASTRPAKLPL